MYLTVLGCYGPYPPAGGACSGYLLREEGCSLLIDCGNGVLSRLQEHLDFRELDAVLLSHLHPDHYSDLLIMRYGLVMAFNSGRRSEALKIYAPPEPAGEFERLPYKNVYSVEPFGPDQVLRIGPFTIETGSVVHAVPGVAMRISSASGTLVYTGDTEYFPGLEAFAREADLLLSEANYQDSDITDNLANHISASQAAKAAGAAGVKRLLLTHHHPDRDREVTRAEAKQYYPAVEMASEGETYIITSGI